MTGERVGRAKERERRNEVSGGPMSDHGNRRDWLRFDHARLRSPASLDVISVHVPECNLG
jgi:hypothetical protein